MDRTRACPLCGGDFEKGTTTFAADFGKGVLVVRHVPALVCRKCGESWLDDETSRQLEELVSKARSRESTIEVIDMAA